MAEYKPQTLRELLKESERRNRNRNAFLLKDMGGAVYGITYEQFSDDVRRLGTALTELCGKGKNIAVFMANSYEWCCSFMAISTGAGTVVPLDKDMPAEELCNILSFAEIDAIITDKERFEVLSDNKERLSKTLKIILNDPTPKGHTLSYKDILKNGEELLKDGYDGYLTAKSQPDDTAAIFFTSGTTGMTKGVMLTNLNLCSDFTAVSEYISIYEGDLALSFLPLHHTYELICFLMVLYSGGSIAFSEGIRTLKEEFSLYKPTVFVTVPLLLEKLDSRILSGIEQSGKRSISKLVSKMSPILPEGTKKKVFHEIYEMFGGRLRMIICGAAALKKETALNFTSYGIPVIIGYGLTECSPIIICNNDREPTSDSVGRPLPGVEIKIENPDANAIGEICAKGPMVMKGYYKNPAQTEKVLKNGWFHTGDLGYEDREGNYHISGRQKNMIVTRGGKNVYPEEIEYYLCRHAAIAECIVTGESADIITAEILPDRDAVKAKLGKENLTYDDIHKAVKEAVRAVNRTLPSYKRIKKVTLREEAFNKTSTHKIKR